MKFLIKQLNSKLILILIVIISVLPFLPVLINQELNYTHDGFVHLVRVAEYYKMLVAGQFPIRWAADFSYGYGMPIFNFIYPLPYFLSFIILIVTGLNAVLTLKLTFLLSFILSGLFMYIFALELLKSQKKAFLVMLLYQFTPFHLSDIFIRGALGESFAFSFLPIVLWSIVRLSQKTEIKKFFVVPTTAVLLVLSHNSISLVFFIISAAFTPFVIKRKKIILLIWSGLFIGLLAGAFYWVPALVENKYTYGSVLMKNYYSGHFPPLLNILVPNINADKKFFTDGIAMQIGIVNLIAVPLSVWFLFKKTIKSNSGVIILFALLTFIVSIFLTQPVSRILWKNISLIQQFQFPWRFLASVVFSTSLLGGFILDFKFFQKRNIYFLLTGLVFLMSIPYWSQSVKFDVIKQNDIWHYAQKGTSLDEFDLIWAAGASSFPKQKVEVISGQGKISNIILRSNSHKFALDASSQVRVVDHNFYFPGWRVYIDGKKLSEIEFQDQNWRGQIEFRVPKGRHSVEIVFGETILRSVSDVISLLGLLLIIAIAVLGQNRKKLTL